MGRSAAEDFIPFFRPSIGPEEEQAVLSVLRSGWLTTGEVTARFEEDMARRTGARHALAVSSATAGLHLALEALGVGPGSAVVTTPYTFAATAEVIRYLGADPVFADVQPDTMNIDPEAVQEACAECSRTGRTVSAILPVHVAGLPCDMASILRIARQHRVPVVEDAAHAFPVSVNGLFVGRIGDAGVYSFYATKTITTGEGGMLVTDRDDVARRARVMRLHGIDRDVWNRYTTPGASWKYDVVAPGFKYNMTDLAAALGRVQLRRATALRERRAAIARRYIEELSGLDFLQLPREAENHAWHLFIVRVREKELGFGRDLFADELLRRGVGVSMHFIPLHTMSYYRQRYGLKPEDFPRALECSRTALSLPLAPAHSDEEIGRVIRSVKEAVSRRTA